MQDFTMEDDASSFGIVDQESALSLTVTAFVHDLSKKMIQVKIGETLFLLNLLQ